MKVLFINPTQRRLLQANLPGPIEKVRGKNQPIGLLYAAAAARRAPGVEVRVIDAHAENLDMLALEKKAAAFAPDVVGLTCISFNLPDVMDCVAAVKKAAPNAQVLIGGLQPYLYPKETLSLPGVDGVFIGEAEKSFAAYLDNSGDPRALKKIPGLMIKCEGEIVNTGPAPLEMNLDELPAPAFDMLIPDLYSSVITDARPTVNLITSRGCPFQCAFCSRSATGKKFRFHSPERVVADARACLDLGYKNLLFYDEVFTVRRERVLAICELIKKENLRFEWMARATANTIDEQMLAAMKQAGCFMTTYGVESGSPRILEKMNRPVRDIDVIRKAFRDSRKAGLETLAYFMVGNPGETDDDLRATRSLMRELDPDHVHISVFVCYPATPFYEQGLRDGLFENDIWRDFAADPSKKISLPTWPQSPPPEKLFAAVQRMNKNFYLNPKVAWRQLKKIRGLSGIAKRWPYLKSLLGF